MQIEIGYRPAHALARVLLDANESITAESGAMVGMSSNVTLQTQANNKAGGGLLGGLMSGIKRLAAGESFFRNNFTAQNGPGEVFLAHALCGDMATLEMTPAGYCLASSAYIASSPHVAVETKVAGMSGFFSGTGLFIMRANSAQPGQVLVGGFGGIQEIVCNGQMIIDTGHLVAWDASLQHQVAKSGSGWIASFLSGEGLVCQFQGQGRIWIQTRNPHEYGRNVGTQLPPIQR